ncbi:MAG: DUF2330 domain-containing protein [Polyangiaceae bacterium]
MIALGALTLSQDREADACGGFFVRGAKPPSLRVERVLIVHDADKEMEHFVRELTFRDATTPFGFVVPTPTKPEVAAVELSPFLGMFDKFPLGQPESSAPRGGGGEGKGHGEKMGGGVTVHSQQRIGSFTAFVLSATDPSDMKKWLEKNQFDTTPESAAWLQHYVELGFFFTAFRYEPKGKAEETGVPEVRGETVRISFPTPLPYYPYLEPDREDALKGVVGSHRVLAVWLVSQKRYVPVAAAQEGDRVWWKQPWKEGRTFSRRSKGSLEDLLGNTLGSLLPAGANENDAEKTQREAIKAWPFTSANGEVLTRDDLSAEGRLTVQAFEDQKVSRKGWGDVVLVPEAQETLDDAAKAKRKAFVRVLDPMIGGTK